MSHGECEFCLLPIEGHRGDGYTAMHRSVGKMQTMELANPLYPMRAVVRCKAQQQLLMVISEAGDAIAGLDEILLNDIATTIFQSEQGQALYTPYRTRDAVNAAEDDLAAEIAMTYQQIMVQRQNPVVQDLNALL